MIGNIIVLGKFVFFFFFDKKTEFTELIVVW